MSEQKIYPEVLVSIQKQERFKAVFGVVVILIFGTPWLAGLVVAQGILKLCALFPPFAYYILMNRILTMMGVV